MEVIYSATGKHSGTLFIGIRKNFNNKQQNPETLGFSSEALFILNLSLLIVLFHIFFYVLITIGTHIHCKKY